MKANCAYITLLLILALNKTGFSQGYADNWVISQHYGFNFSTGQPIPFSSSASNFITTTYCNNLSSISDKNGNLLVYVAGDTIYNKNHLPIENGSDIYYDYGSGHGSRSILIPVNDSIIYLVYTANRLSPLVTIPSGLYLSKINMNHNNGLGKVMFKNQLLIQSGTGGFLSLYNSVKNQYEIHFDHPTKSVLIFNNNGFSLKNKLPIDPIGSSKLHPSGTLVATAGHNPWQFPDKVGFWLYSYNPNNSNFTQLVNFYLDSDYFGDLAFSPSGKYMYATIWQENPLKSYLYRFDISSLDSATIVNSKTNLHTLSYPHPYHSLSFDLQLGIDEKIYVTIPPFQPTHPTLPSTIGVINHPDSTLYPGNFDPSAFTMTGKQKPFYFPNFIQNWIAQPPFRITHSCQDSVVFDLTYKNMVDSVLWNFGDPASGALNTSTDLKPTHHYSSYGKYYATVITHYKNITDTLGDTVWVEPSPSVTLPNDTLICAGESITIDISQGFAANYLWNTGSTDSIISFTKSGYYQASAFNHCGSSTDQFILTVLDPPEYQLSDTTLCEETRIILDVEAPMASYFWNTGDTTAQLIPQTTGSYWVDVENPCGALTDEAYIEYRKCDCRVFIPNSFTPNGDGHNDVYNLQTDCLEVQYTFAIYDRWGNQMAVLTENSEGWDGTLNGSRAPQGVYTFRLELEGLENDRLVRKYESGTISLIY